jgi:hypothetical protein
MRSMKSTDTGERRPGEKRGEGVAERLENGKNPETNRFFNPRPPPFLAIPQFFRKDLNRAIDGTVQKLR